MTQNFIASLIPLGVLILIGGTGFFKLVFARNELLERRTTLIEYLNKLNEFVAKYFLRNDLDENLFTWLTLRLSKIQTELGASGIVSYKLAGMFMIDHHYEIFTNAIPAMIRGRSDTNRDDVYLCVTILTTQIGALEDRIERIGKHLKNPLIWLREGARFIIASPFALLSEIGLLGRNVVDRFSGSRFANFVSGFIVLVGLLSSVVSIAVGWETFTVYVQRVLEWFPP